jgi:hypothetical protein
MFVVRHALAEGWECFGPGADKTALRGIGVPLDMPSLLHDAVSSGAPVVREPDQDGIDALLVKDLQRPGGNKLLVLPITLRGRTTALLWGDDGETDVAATWLNEVLALAPLVSRAIERILVERRKAKRQQVSKSDSDSRPSTMTGLKPVVAPTPPESAPRTAPMPMTVPTNQGRDPRRTTQSFEAGPPPRPSTEGATDSPEAEPNARERRSTAPVPSPDSESAHDEPAGRATPAAQDQMAKQRGAADTHSVAHDESAGPDDQAPEADDQSPEADASASTKEKDSDAHQNNNRRHKIG